MGCRGSAGPPAVSDFARPNAPQGLNGSGSPHSGHELVPGWIFALQIWHLSQGDEPQRGQTEARFDIFAPQDAHSMSFPPFPRGGRGGFVSGSRVPS